MNLEEGNQQGSADQSNQRPQSQPPSVARLVKPTGSSADPEQPNKPVPETLETFISLMKPSRQKKAFSAHSHMLGNTRQTVFASNIALSYVNVGASIAWVSPLLYEVKKKGLVGVKLNFVDSMLVGSVMFFAMLVTAVPVGLLCNVIGRKWTLVFAGVISCVSWLLVVFVNDISMVYAARVLAGFWAGVVMTIVPLYIAEVARPKIRGTLAAMKDFMMIFGFELTFVLGPNVELKFMAITCGILPHVFLILMIYLPESPMWLIHKKRYTQAQKNFEWLRGMRLAENPELMKEFVEMAKAVEKDFPLHGNFRGLYATHANRKALLIVEMLYALQRLTGMTAVTAYSTVTIPDSNIGSLRPADVITVLGMVWVLSTVVNLILVDKVGRIPLLVTSCIGCYVSNVACATWFYVNSENIGAPFTLAAHWFPFGGFMVYGISYIIGIGSIPGTLQGEMFSPANRAVASAVTVIVMSFFSGLINIMYFPLARGFGWHANFVVYSVFSMLTLVFVLAFVPETKGKPLHVIQEELGV